MRKEEEFKKELEKLADKIRKLLGELEGTWTFEDGREYSEFMEEREEKNYEIWNKIDTMVDEIADKYGYDYEFNGLGNIPFSGLGFKHEYSITNIDFYDEEGRNRYTIKVSEHIWVVCPPASTYYTYGYELEGVDVFEVEEEDP